MNKYQKSKLNSSQLVVTEAKDNQSIVDTIPAFAKGIIKLDGINKEIELIYIQQQDPISGITTEKGTEMTSLVDWTLELIGGIHSHATAINDEVLIGKVNYTVSEVEHMGIVELRSTASNILNLLKATKTEDLTEQGITIEDINNYEKLINTFSDSKLSPRQAIIDRSEHTEKLVLLFKDMHNLLTHTLDPLAIQFKRKAPAYYYKFKAARMLIMSTPQKVKPVPTPKPTTPIAPATTPKTDTTK